MSQFTSQEFVLWAAKCIALVTLAVELIARRIWRDYPLFTTFITFFAAKTTFLWLYAHRASKIDYFIVYWILQSLYSALMLSVVVELVDEVCLPGRMISGRVMRLYFGMAAMVTVVAYTFAHLENPTRFPILNGFIALDRSCAFTALGLMGVLILFASAFTVRWRPQARAIASGLTAVIIVTTVVPTSSQYFLGLGRTLTLTFSPVVITLVSALWIVAFGKRARCVTPEASGELERLLGQAHNLSSGAAA